ncbi:MAG: helix-turn-helix transcriptional regulator [Bauldia sp.]|nr:helix-turn-helix transcriptional regulator [Bauldia sp.]
MPASRRHLMLPPETLIDAIYDSALDPSAPTRVASLLRERYDVNSALLSLYRRDGHVVGMVAAGADDMRRLDDQLARYERDYRSCDFISLVKGETVSLQNMGVFYGAEPFYTEYLRAVDSEHINLIRVPFGELTFGIMLIRGRAQRSFGKIETRDFFDLAVHFRRSCRLYRLAHRDAAARPDGAERITTIAPVPEGGRPAPTGAALSRAEEDIVRGLRSGMKLREIAAERGVSYETVRTQVKRALVKTGARSQAHLVSLMP